MSSRKLQRLYMNMPTDLINQIDEYANRMNLNRTSATIFLVSTALEQKNAMSKVEELLNKLSELEAKARG
jgi:metal-responsive CopG/Arc/MetJ family transcriptional regulator